MSLAISLQGGVSGGTWTSDRRLWLTKDDELVEDGDLRAAVLFATPGYPVPVMPVKQGDRPKDKMAPRARDKGRGPADQIKTQEGAA